MWTIDHAVLAGGAAIALFAGVAAAEIGLRPLHGILAAEAPSVDTTIADTAPGPIQADLHGVASIPPPAMVPVKDDLGPSPRPYGAGSTAPEPPVDAEDVPISQDAARDPAPELDRGPGDTSEDLGAGQVEDPPVPATTDPAEDAPSVSPG